MPVGGHAPAGPVDAAQRRTLFATVRDIERANPGLPPVGTSARAAEDPVRFAQPPSLAFPAGEVAGRDGQRLLVHCFGLLGPSGPLPLSFTEYLHDRAVQAGDHGPARFLDIFHHRLTSLFYRAWAATEPAVAHDRPDRDWYRGILLALGGGAAGAGTGVDDSECAALAGLLQARTRGAQGLSALLSLVCRVPVTVETFVPSQVPLEAEDRCRLGCPGPSGRLGSAVVGRNRHSRTDAIRVVLGPMGGERFHALAPGGDGFRRLRWCLRTWLAQPLEAEVRWQLDGAEVPRTRLGASCLGRDTWMRARPDPARLADDLRVVVGSHAPHPADRPLAPPPPAPSARRPTPLRADAPAPAAVADAGPASGASTPADPDADQADAGDPDLFIVTEDPEPEREHP